MENVNRTSKNAVSPTLPQRLREAKRLCSDFADGVIDEAAAEIEHLAADRDSHQREAIRAMERLAEANTEVQRLRNAIEAACYPDARAAWQIREAVQRALRPAAETSAAQCGVYQGYTGQRCMLRYGHPGQHTFSGLADNST